MLKQGLYEQLINQELKEEIRSAEAAERQRVETGAVDAAESARVLAEYVAKLLEKRLTAVAEESGKEEAEEEQVRLINQMLSTLGSESGKDLLPLTEERRVDQLLSVVNTKNSRSMGVSLVRARLWRRVRSLRVQIMNCRCLWSSRRKSSPLTGLIFLFPL